MTDHSDLHGAIADLENHGYSDERVRELLGELAQLRATAALVLRWGQALERVRAARDGVRVHGEAAEYVEANNAFGRVDLEFNDYATAMARVAAQGAKESP